MDPSAIWRSYSFPTPVQSKTVAAGATETIYELKIPGSHHGFIMSVANNCLDDTIFHWYIDGIDKEPEGIERQFGNMGTPLELNPPIYFGKSIVVKAYNGDTEANLLEWLSDGIILYK